MAFYEFDHYKIDVTQRVLLRGGELIPLAPKAVDLLLALMEAEGRVVGKDELLKRVWPDTFVEEGSLTQNISILRKTLGENPIGPQYIQTVAKRGYRFAAPLKLADAAPEPQVPRRVEPPGQHRLAGLVEKPPYKIRAEPYAFSEAVLEPLTNAASQTPNSQAPIRLAVLPFRLLRRHEASDFLSVSLPDAITMSLAAIDSLVVRSTIVSSRYAGSELDLRTIAEQAQVDAVVTGAILSDGERLRVTAQLVRAPDGALLWSDTMNGSLRDIFKVQDELVDRIVQSLALPLRAHEQRALKQDVPASVFAYELFLRANQLVAVGYEAQQMVLARDLYLRSLELDPKYAPAWAYLGRTYRFIGKYCVEDQAENFALAEKAFRKSLSLHPDLGIAHNFFAALETEMGRAPDVLERLLKRAHLHRNDPNLLAGLVNACRYCGLLEASAAAHELAVRLDPHIRTSVGHTYLQLGEFQKALDCGTADPYAKAAALEGLGRRLEAIECDLEIEKIALMDQLRLLAVCDRARLEGDRVTSMEAIDRAVRSGPSVNDPEAHYWVARLMALLDEQERSAEYLARALDSGYRWSPDAMLRDSALAQIASHPRWAELAARALALGIEVRKIFLENDGNRILGVAYGMHEVVPISDDPGR